MRLPSIIAIYTLFWPMSFFLVLPFRLRVRRDIDDDIDEGESRFSLARTCGWTTIVSAMIFALFYLNYIEEWIVPAHV